ncbi:MAG: hypothetical protein IME99_01505 [Proteobacteria bacterium]|nr:hypothetical protein [Pseudomonadota bacterium]
MKDDVTLTETGDELADIGELYRGPLYNVAIIAFENRTPSKAIDVGGAATEILRSIVKKSGLEPILLTSRELSEQEKLIALEQTGAVRKGKKESTRGFEDIDYRISGAITSYAEVEEGSKSLISKSKTLVAKVQVDYALVDIESGRSLVADTGYGEYKKKTGSTLGFGTKSTGDASIRDGALRDALTKAMVRMVEKLNEEPFVSNILAIEGERVYIRAGTKSRFKPGTVFNVYRPGSDLVDPTTGRVIGKSQRKIGSVKLTEHQGLNVSEAKLKSGSGFKKGDIVRSQK